MNFPLPVFDDEWELADEYIAELMWSLVFEAGLSIEELREWFKSTGRVN